MRFLRRLWVMGVLGLVATLCWLTLLPMTGADEALHVVIDVDYGVLPKGSSKVRLQAKNDSSRHWRVVGVDASCGCVSPVAESNSVGPGEQLIVNAQISAEGRGERQEFLVTARLDAGVVKWIVKTSLAYEEYLDSNNIRVIARQDNMFSGSTWLLHKAPNHASAQITGQTNAIVDASVGRPVSCAGGFRSEVLVTEYLVGGGTGSASITIKGGDGASFPLSVDVEHADDGFVCVSPLSAVVVGSGPGRGRIAYSARCRLVDVACTSDGDHPIKIADWSDGAIEFTWENRNGKPGYIGYLTLILENNSIKTVDVAFH